MLYVAHAKGAVSKRTLADVFDLSRARVRAIVREFAAKTAGVRNDGSTPAAPG